MLCLNLEMNVAETSKFYLNNAWNKFELATSVTYFNVRKEEISLHAA